MLNTGDKKWQLGHLRAVWAGHGPIFPAGCWVLSWEVSVASFPGHGHPTLPLSGTSMGARRGCDNDLTSQPEVISSPMERSPLPNYYLIVSPTSPFPPVESCLCGPPCLNPFLVRLPVLECSWRVMYLPEFLHRKLQHVPFKQFSQECWEAESVLLAAQERRNTSNTNLL